LKLAVVEEQNVEDEAVPDIFLKLWMKIRYMRARKK
jgi:hypothetical protein